MKNKKSTEVSIDNTEAKLDAVLAVLPTDEYMPFKDVIQATQLAPQTVRKWLFYGVDKGLIFADTTDTGRLKGAALTGTGQHRVGGVLTPVPKTKKASKKKKAAKRKTVLGQEDIGAALARGKLYAILGAIQRGPVTGVRVADIRRATKIPNGTIAKWYRRGIAIGWILETPSSSGPSRCLQLTPVGLHAMQSGQGETLLFDALSRAAAGQTQQAPTPAPLPPMLLALPPASEVPTSLESSALIRVLIRNFDQSSTKLDFVLGLLESMLDLPTLPDDSKRMALVVQTLEKRLS